MTFEEAGAQVSSVQLVYPAMKLVDMYFRNVGAHLARQSSELVDGYTARE